MGEILVAVVLGVGSGLLIAWWLSKAAGLKNQAELDAMLADADRERKELLDAAELEAETLRAEAARQNEQLVKKNVPSSLGVSVSSRPQSGPSTPHSPSLSPISRR